MKLFDRVLFAEAFVVSLCIVESAFAENKISLEERSPSSLLEKAIFEDSIEGIKEAIQFGANANFSNGKAPILLAVLLKKSKAVDALIQSGANLDIVYEGYKLAQHSFKLGDFKSALSLVKAGAPFSGYIDHNERNVMDLALKYSYCDEGLELIQVLIDQGHPIHSSDWHTNGCYTAIYTNLGGRDRVRPSLQMMIKNGIDANQTINIPYLGKNACTTPLLLAVEYAEKDIIMLLLESGADINKKANCYPQDKVLYSPLSLAIKYRPVMIEVLLEYGADF